jgi:uncharacterized protein (TIGR02594 family)
MARPVEGFNEPVAPHMAIAIAEEGVKERLGPRDNPDVLKYIATIVPSWNPLFRDSTPWCSAFVNWVLRQTYPSYRGQRARARAWKTYGAPVSKALARYGDIVIIERGIPGIGGHVGFFLRYEGDFVVLFGGNQRNMVCEAKYHRHKILHVRRVPALAA